MHWGTVGMDVLVLVGWVWVLYWRVFKCGYVIDDLGIASYRRTDYQVHNWVRNLKATMFWQPKFEHACSTLIHTGVVLGIYFLFRGVGGRELGFWSALLFSSLPSNNQGSIWLTGRGYSMSTLLTVWGMVLLPLFPVLYFVSLYWSGAAVPVPLFFLTTHPHFFFLLFPLLLLLGWKKIKREWYGRFITATEEMRGLTWRKLILVAKSYGYYFRWSLLPFKMGMYHSFLFTYGLTPEDNRECYKRDGYFWFGLLVFFTLLGMSIYHWSVGVQWLWWFTLAILPWCNLVMVHQAIAERYVYLPNVGLMGALAFFLLRLPYPYSHLALAVVVTGYATRLWLYIPVYRNNLEYFKSNCANFPDLYNAYNNCGAEYLHANKVGAALDTWLEGIALRPGDFKLNLNSGIVLMMYGRWQDAVVCFDRAEKGIHVQTGELEAITDLIQRRRFCLGKIAEIQAMMKQAGTNTAHIIQAGGGNIQMNVVTVPPTVGDKPSGTQVVVGDSATNGGTPKETTTNPIVSTS